LPPRRTEPEMTRALASNPKRMTQEPGAWPAIASTATAIGRARSADDHGDDQTDDSHDDSPIAATTVAADVGDDGPLDEAVIAALASDLSDELMPAVVATFIDEAKQRIRAIEQAAALGDAAQAGEEGHALKGSAATFGARQLREIAFAIEEAGRAGSLEAVRAQLDALRNQGSLAIDALGVRYCGADAIDG
jgi:HPt (histidine-containing phosphotransfer) domain-containing protein